MGLKQIAALLNVSERRLRELRDRKNLSYDPKVAEAIKYRDGRYIANAGFLGALAGARLGRTSLKRRAAVAQRLDRRARAKT